LVILQHPSETRHPFNTARMVQLAVERSQICIGESFQLGFGALSQFSLDNYQPMLLFPGEASRPPSEYRSDFESSAKIPLLIVPDGTWRKAKKILHYSPTIAALPRVDLGELGESQYGVRKSSQPGGVSTVEACYYFLSQWHADSERFASLLTPLNWLTQRQQEYRDL